MRLRTIIVGTVLGPLIPMLPIFLWAFTGGLRDHFGSAHLVVCGYFLFAYLIGLFAYLIGGLPALVASAIYASVERLIPRPVQRMAVAATCGFVVIVVMQLLVSHERALGAWFFGAAKVAVLFGLVPGFVCAFLVEIYERDRPPVLRPPGMPRDGSRAVEIPPAWQPPGYDELWR